MEEKKLTSALCFTPYGRMLPNGNIKQFGPEELLLFFLLHF
jgi:hypothetical protein